MDFSDDDDCFCRYDQEEAFMGNEEESFQPEEEMLPPEEDCPPMEDEIGAEVEDAAESTPSRSTQGCNKDEGFPATLPLVETSWSEAQPVSNSCSSSQSVQVKSVVMGLAWRSLTSPPSVTQNSISRARFSSLQR